MSPTTEPTARALRAARIDWSPQHRQPSPLAVVAATALALAGSLAVDALLVYLGTRAFPSTKGYTHFRFSDYATLTIIGVVIACAAWPIVTRISSAPRWLFVRAAVLVTLVLWAPDFYLLAVHQPVRAVLVLMVMHLGIAVVTYNALVHLAPVRAADTEASGLLLTAPGEPVHASETTLRHGATSLAVLVAIEFALGIGSLFRLPIERSNGGLPTRGGPIYLAHAAVGLPLGLCAAALFFLARDSSRTYRMAAAVGFVGVLIATVGGFCTLVHQLRVFGMLFMLAGTLSALFGYLIPTLERLPRGTPPQGMDLTDLTMSPEGRRSPPRQDDAWWPPAR